VILCGFKEANLRKGPKVLKKVNQPINQSINQSINFLDFSVFSTKVVTGNTVNRTKRKYNGV